MFSLSGDGSKVNEAEEIKKDVFNEMRMEELDGLEKQNKDS